MKLLLNFLFITFFIFISSGLYAQGTNSNSNNEQTEPRSLWDPNFITFKLNCNTTNCGFQIVNSNNESVAVFYGDGEYTFTTYLDYINWYWKYHGDDLFVIHATPTNQAIYMNTPVYVSDLYSNLGIGDINVYSGLFVYGRIHVDTMWSGNVNPIIFRSNVRMESGGCYLASWSSCSDIRLKKNISIIPNALDKVLSINGITFYWRKGEIPGFNFEDGEKIGFIAQDMEKVVPEIVKTEPDGYKYIDYANLTPVIVEAIKDQQKIIDLQNTN